VERVTRALATQPDVEVRVFTGDLGQLVRETEASVLIVALRSTSDVERTLANLRPVCEAIGVELLALLAEPAHAYVTTALVRDVARLGGDISPFVPESGVS
jgi:pantetheine-phosphate adenylyltransferase